MRKDETRTGGERTNLLPRFLEVLRLMRRTNVGVIDALGLLADGLRTLEEHEQRMEAAEHLPLPKWLYGQSST